MQHRWAPPKPVTWSLKAFLEHQSRHSHGDGTKENITARRPHFCVADEQHERNGQTLWYFRPVTPAANHQSLRLEMANLKDNSSQEDSQNPNSPVKGRGARKDMVDGIITLGDISVEMTDKKISLSQQQISSAGLVEVLTPAHKSPVKSASEPDVSILSPREAEAQGFNKVALDPKDLNLKQEYCEQSMRTPTVLTDVEDKCPWSATIQEMFRSQDSDSQKKDEKPAGVQYQTEGAVPAVGASFGGTDIFGYHHENITYQERFQNALVEYL